MESWENFGSFSVTSELTGLMKPSHGCTSGHFNLWRNFAGDAHLEGYWNSFVGWFSIYYFSLSDRKGHLHLQLHWLAEDTCEKRKRSSLPWLRPHRAWAVCRAWWLGWKMHQVNNLQLFLSEYDHFSCSHRHRNSSFGFFFLRSRIIWSVFLYYFLLKDLLFSRWSHLEKDGCTRTPPSDLSPPLY